MFKWLRVDELIISLIYPLILDKKDIPGLRFTPDPMPGASV